MKHLYIYIYTQNILAGVLSTKLNSIDLSKFNITISELPAENGFYAGEEERDSPLAIISSRKATVHQPRLRMRQVRYT